MGTSVTSRAWIATTVAAAIVASVLPPFGSAASAGDLPFTRVASDSPFTDVASDSPFVGDIQWLVDQGITNGYPDGGFHPAASVTRGAFAAFLYRFAGEGTGGACSSGSPFSDVPAVSAFCTEITWLASTGVSTGYSDGTFGPTAVISRQAISAFLYRFDHRGVGRDSADGVCLGDSAFPDIDTGSPFCEAISWMSSVGPAAITTGYPDGTFGATAPASRQAIAAWLHRYRTDAPVQQSGVSYDVAPDTVEIAAADVVAVDTTITTPTDSDLDGLPDATSGTTSVLQLASGSEAPIVGNGLVITPDSAQPGLAGVVTDVTTNPDGSLAVTVGAAPLDDVFDSLSVQYDGPIDLAAASEAAMSLSPVALALRTTPAAFAGAGLAHSSPATTRTARRLSRNRQVSGSR